MEVVLLSNLSSSPIVDGKEGKVRSRRSNMKDEVSTAWPIRSFKSDDTIQCPEWESPCPALREVMGVVVRDDPDDDLGE